MIQVRNLRCSALGARWGLTEMVMGRSAWSGDTAAILGYLQKASTLRSKRTLGAPTGSLSW